MPPATFASALAVILASVGGGQTPSAAAPTPDRPRRALARTWRGATRPEDAETYLEYQRGTGLRSYQRTPGNLGVTVLTRNRGSKTEFLMVSLWESEDSIRRFAGDTIDRAVFYPEDDRYLVERDEHVDHFEVVFQEGGLSR